MAAIVCKKTKVIYFPAPKNGSTSLRQLFFELENGFHFRKFTINGRSMDLFWLYRNQELFKAVSAPAGYERIAVVREPVSRFLSNYTWLVTDGNGNFPKKLEIDDFIDALEEVMEHSSKARYHLMPQRAFLGADLSYYDRVFRMEDMAELYRYLSERGGLKIELSWENRSSNNALALSRDSRKKLGEIYQGDYALLQKLYPFEAA
jgi:hypothetical protein